MSDSVRPAVAEAGVKSVIGNDLKIIGQGLKIITQGTLQVHGEIEGDVGGAEVIIGERGKVTGTVAAGRVIVRGFRPHIGCKGATMRGSDQRCGEFFSYVDIEARIPARHPLRAILGIVNEGLSSLDGEFDKLYADAGRDSIPPERLLRGALLQVFFSIRSERLLMEQINYNLLYRWFVGLGMDDAVWDHSVFSKNRDRLLEADMAAKFLSAVLPPRQPSHGSRQDAPAEVAGSWTFPISAVGHSARSSFTARPPSVMAASARCLRSSGM